MVSFLLTDSVQYSVNVDLPILPSIQTLMGCPLQLTTCISLNIHI